MEQQLPFYNFSLKKVLACEPDSFKRAKLKIVLTILVFSLVKAFIVVPLAIQYALHLQVSLAIIVGLLFLTLIKVLLYRPSNILFISHIIVLLGLLILWMNLFVYTQHITIVTIQLVYTVALISYYLFGGAQAACYTIVAIFPVLFYMLTNDRLEWHLVAAPQELPTPAYGLIIFLNFLTFVLVHYLYHRAFYQNLREKEILNQQLQINIIEAKALAESRTLFLSTMSHELRTPLNGVIGMASLLRDTALEAQKDNLDVLEFSATNLLSLINDILDYNKSELDKIELEALPVNLCALLQKISSGLQIKALEKGLYWKMEIDDQLTNRLIVTDSTRLTQIIYNLAGNAIKFTESGTVTVSARMLRQADNYITVQFSVVDTGIGIVADRQEAIFDPFTQASSDTTRHFGGTGLGLAIVKKLLRLFGSAIHLESQIGIGSTFSFTIEFPLCQQEIAPVLPRKVENSSLKGIKVLIVDDNAVNVLLLEQLLSKWEIQTAAAVNGREAVSILTEHTFDVVLMDLHMPVMDGYAATLAIRSLDDPARAKVPIIALSASVSHNIYAKIKEVGMQDYLSKPIHLDLLHEKLEQVFVIPGLPASDSLIQ